MKVLSKIRKKTLIVFGLVLGLVSAQGDGVFDQFATPAYINDFQNSPSKRELIHKLWSDDIINSWTRIAIVGDPWQNRFDHQRWAYFNPLGKELPAQKDIVNVTPLWFAFPHRVEYFGEQAGYTREEIYRFGDYGVLEDGTPLPWLPLDRCSPLPALPMEPNPPNKEYGPWNPAGPRGWLDEYCEWSVKREDSTIIAINFTCENPEYWNTLWTVDPERTRSLVEELVNWGKNQNGSKRKVVLKEDFYLRDCEGKIVYDPQTGRPAYDTLNRWNRGTHTLEDSGCALHLTSPPNSLGAEIFLAAAATILRTDGEKRVLASQDKNPVLAARDLVCSGRFGGVHRNSDPHIGDAPNQVVRTLGSQVMVTLTDPVGLYIHQPDFSRFDLPSSATGITIEDCWNIVRGRPGMALHVVFQVPEGQDFTINDIKVDGQPIRYAGQIAETFQIGLTASAGPIDDAWPPMTAWPPSKQFPSGNKAPALKAYPSVDSGKLTEEKNSKKFSPQATQPILGKELFLAQSEIRPQLGFLTPRFERGKKYTGYVLPAAGAVKKTKIIAPSDSGVRIKVVGFEDVEDQGVGMLELEIKIGKEARLGLVPLIIRNPNNPKNLTPAQGLMQVVAHQ